MTVFAVGSVQSGYKRSECSDIVHGQLRVSRKLKRVQKNFEFRGSTVMEDEIAGLQSDLKY
jgi:hypothetical protein